MECTDWSKKFCRTTQGVIVALKAPMISKQRDENSGYMSYLECEHFAVMPLHFLLPLSSICPCKFCWTMGAGLQGAEADAEALPTPDSVWGWYFRLALICSPSLNTQLWLEHFKCTSEAYLSMFVCELQDWPVNWINAQWAGMRGDWLQKCISDHTEKCEDISFSAQQGSSVQGCPPAMCKTHLEGGATQWWWRCQNVASC